MISVIGGTAGVAHQVADRFPDGQLFVDLRRFSPDGRVVTPAEAVRRFLDALYVPPERIPVDLEAVRRRFTTLICSPGHPHPAPRLRTPGHPHPDHPNVARTPTHTTKPLQSTGFAYSITGNFGLGLRPADPGRSMAITRDPMRAGLAGDPDR
ncbi:MAG TPA: hypothetical protein VFC19_30280 [Candidatus Limnocylindrales bacterium]|nr:hypothetical protein [Candidatus Limnocylindrales bacterium]